jgi:hypothetical protein
MKNEDEEWEIGVMRPLSGATRTWAAETSSPAS